MSFAAVKGIRNMLVEAWSLRRSVSKTSPVRILHLIETGGPGGAERMMLDLAMNLDEGYESTIGLLKEGWLKSQVLSMEMPCVFLANKRLGDIGVLVNLVRCVRARKIQLIHAHEFYMNAVGAAISMLTGIPLVVTVHGKSYYPEKRRRCLVYRMIAARAAGLVAVSRDLKKFLCQTTGVFPEQVQIIYNGVNTERFVERPRDPTRLDHLGIPRDSFIVGAVGNLYRVKGHIHLIRAAKIVCQKYPKTHVVILGRGDQKDNLLAEAGRLGIENYIHLLGYCDDVSNWLTEMDVFTLPSLSEGLPLSLLEAMAMGIPTIVTAVGGMQEVVCDGQTGCIVPPGDPEALARKILYLLESQSQAEELGRAGQRRVLQHFSLCQMVNQYRDLYKKVLPPQFGDGSISC